MSEENTGSAGTENTEAATEEETVQESGVLNIEEAALELKYSELPEKALTFRKKADLVDARQFTGGISNAQDLSIWLNLKGFKPGWESRTIIYTDAEGTLKCDTKENFTAEVIPGRPTTVPTDGWLVYELDGSLSVYSAEKFTTLYEQV